MQTLEAEIARRRRVKNIVLAFALLALVVLFYLITLIKMSANTP